MDEIPIELYIWWLDNSHITQCALCMSKLTLERYRKGHSRHKMINLLTLLLELDEMMITALVTVH